MSYSFVLRGATKTEAKAKVAAEFSRVAIAQPSHAHDRDQAQAAVFVFIDLLADDEETTDVQVTCSGSLAGTWVDGEGITNVIGAQMSVHANRIVRDPYAGIGI